jgi:hypothetical protein
MGLAGVALLAILAVPAIARAQAAAPPVPPMDVHALKNFLPIGPPAPLPASKVPDLSGDWGISAPAFGQSMSAADPGGRMRGKEPDIPYQPNRYDDRRPRRLYQTLARPQNPHPVGDGIHALSMGLFGA